MAGAGTDESDGDCEVALSCMPTARTTIIRTLNGIIRTLNGISAARTAGAGQTDSPQGWRTARAVVPLLRGVPMRLAAGACASVSLQRRAPDRCFCLVCLGSCLPVR